MGGECSQKLRPWRGMTLLSGAQQTSGSLENQHSTSKSRVLLEDRCPDLSFSRLGRRGYDCGISFPETVLCRRALPGEPNAQAPFAFPWERLGVCYAH
jgi:hypothetical protein